MSNTDNATQDQQDRAREWCDMHTTCKTDAEYWAAYEECLADIMAIDRAQDRGGRVASFVPQARY